MTKFFTFDEIVADVVSNLNEDSIRIIRQSERSEMLDYYTSTGRHIRNKYGLWDKDNPLTAPWYIERNTDIGMSEYHPDYVAIRVLYAVWEQVNEFWTSLEEVPTEDSTNG